MRTPVRPAPTTTVTRLVDTSQVGEARREVGAACRTLGLSEADAGRAGIVVTEAATNVVRHGRGGEVLIQPMVGASGLEIVALDRGPGITDMARAFADGHSTGGTPGNGLGAMRRLSSFFDAYSQPGQGTAMLMQIRTAGASPRPSIESGGICRPKPGETECGDVWDAGQTGAGYRVVVADGLGHGPLAREAALVALAATDGETPSRAMENAHRASRATRGVALALAEVELASGTLRFVGCGNLAAVLLGPGGTRSLVSMNGIVGQRTLKPREFVYPFTAGSLLVIWSDGLSSRWSAEQYPGLLSRHPTLVASVLYRDHARDTDDAAVVVSRLGGAA